MKRRPTESFATFLASLWAVIAIGLKIDVAWTAGIGGLITASTFFISEWVDYRRGDAETG